MKLFNKVARSAIALAGKRRRVNGVQAGMTSRTMALRRRTWGAVEW